MQDAKVFCGSHLARRHLHHAISGVARLPDSKKVMPDAKELSESYLEH